ncbi:MAG: glycosyltransferase [Candidatus Omnitrophota bacterium]
MSTSSFKARIVILNYNGEEMLAKCLPSIAEAVRCAKTPTAVTILDNLSIDQSESYVRKNYPEMEFVKAPENLVLCSYNDYLKTVSEPIAILLNNDIQVDKNFIDPMVEKFSGDPRTFLVAPRCHSFDKANVEAVDARMKIRFGMPWISARYPGYEAHTMIPSKTVSSGFGAFSKEKFLELGGYDRRYLPGIMEDVDLCLKAQRSGYHLYYEPRSLVYHMGQVSFKKAYTSLRRETIACRNTFLFAWKNFRGFGFWFRHILFLPLWMVFSLLRLRPEFPLGLFEALRHGSGHRDILRGIH